MEYVLKSISVLEEDGEKYIGMDNETQCRHCGTNIIGKEASNNGRREVNLHTLHHGSMKVDVMDLICPKCQCIVPYDGFGDALFCASNKNMYTRELLVSWVYDVCAVGAPFRDSFASWMSCLLYTSPSPRDA